MRTGAAGRPSTLPGQELGEAVRACRGAFVGVGLISSVINVLFLTGAIFMLEIYDRVLPSRSVSTLVGLSILAGGLYLAHGLLDLIRARTLVRIGTALDEALSGRVFDAVARMPLVSGGNEGLQPLRDLDNVRSFLSGIGPSSLFDLPWIPVYLAICFAFHPMIGLTALIGAVILIGLTILTECLTRARANEALRLAMRRSDIASASHRNAEVLRAMGMAGRVRRQWSEINRSFLDGNQGSSDVVGGFSAVAKVFRLALQSAVLGVGAYLVIYQQATAGIIIAGSIISARALAPVDLAIANWKAFVTARQSWQRLNTLLGLMPPDGFPTVLEAPSQRLAVEGVTVLPPDTARRRWFTTRASRSRPLLRALAAVWAPAHGTVRLDAVFQG